MYMDLCYSVFSTLAENVKIFGKMFASFCREKISKYYDSSEMEARRRGPACIHPEAASCQRQEPGEQTKQKKNLL